jgi:hypothetical protein
MNSIAILASPPGRIHFPYEFDRDPRLFIFAKLLSFPFASNDPDVEKMVTSSICFPW